MQNVKLVIVEKPIYVHADGRITITFADELKRVVDCIENNRLELTAVQHEAVS